MTLKGLILLILSLNTFACLSINAPESINVSISPLSKSKYIYDKSGLSFEEMPDIIASNCSSTATKNQYTMFTVGIENYVLTDKFLTYSINDRLTYGGNDFCRIENIVNTNGTTKAERDQRLLKRRRLLNRCLEFKVQDQSETGLEYPESQPGCKVTRINKNTATFKGYYCFFKPKIDSTLRFKPIINNECLDYKFYQENNIELQDILASIGTYVAGDASGKSSSLTYVKDFKFRINQSPEEFLAVNKTVEENEPKFPTKWSVKDIDLGKLDITFAKTKEEMTLLNIPIFARNICKKTCQEGICTSPCNYTQPLAVEFVLSQLRKGKTKSYIKSWFDGGIVPANWSGFVNGIGAQLTQSYLTEGEEYELEVLVDDQEYNFMMLRGSIKSRLVLRPTTIPNINREGTTIGKLNPYVKIQTLKELPTYPVFDTIKFTGNSHLGVKNTVNSISRVFEDPIWPPYFTDYCYEESCVLMKDHRLKLVLKFKIIKNKESGELSHEVINYKRVGNIQENKTINNYEAPYFTCTPPGQDPTDDDDDDDFGDIDF